MVVARPTYIGAHTRVYMARGRAAEHACHCGVQAEQWAYDHTDPDEIRTMHKDQQGRLRNVAYSGNPTHYKPMCRPCHVQFDKERSK